MKGKQTLKLKIPLKLTPQKHFFSEFSILNFLSYHIHDWNREPKTKCRFFFCRKKNKKMFQIHSTRNPCQNEGLQDHAQSKFHPDFFCNFTNTIFYLSTGSVTQPRKWGSLLWSSHVSCSTQLLQSKKTVCGYACFQPHWHIPVLEIVGDLFLLKREDSSEFCFFP